MAECGQVISELKHPYQLIEFYRTIYPVFCKFTDKARFYIEKAYYKQAKLKPTLIFPVEAIDINQYRKFLSKYTDFAHKAIWLNDNELYYALIYRNDGQIWFILNKQGELIRETSISYSK